MNKLILLLSVVSLSTFAKEPVNLDWGSLRPQQTQASVALPTLNTEQQRKLQKIFSLTYANGPKNNELISSLKSELKAEGLDADELFRIREAYILSQEQAASTITTQFDGEKVRIPGFLVPIEYSEALIGTEFLLVPVAGACIHMPPPPTNQIVRVSYPKGFEVQFAQSPVWVEGVFHSHLRSEDVFIVDGMANISMGYELEANQIQDYFEVTQ